MDGLVAAAGAFLVVVVALDVFQAVILPRPVVGSRVGIARALIFWTWRLWRGYCLGLSTAARERRLALFGPSLLVTLLGVWVLLLALGYGAILFALRADVRPVPTDLWSAVYLAATSLLTIGFGDLVPTSPASRAVTLVAGASGLILVALSITFIFSLYAFLQRRELLVTTLDQRAGGAPPSGIALLETHATFGMVDDLPRIFASWELWSAEVLDSHLAYPLLTYFRSSHDNESWVSALGAMLDAATLCETTIENVPGGQATMLRRAGSHLVEDVTAYFNMAHDHEPGVERAEFDLARERLEAVGYSLRDADASWEAFSTLRAGYAADLNSMARYWAVPPAQWIGDRSPMPHRPA
jgi:hypothetical protein